MNVDHDDDHGGDDGDGNGVDGDCNCVACNGDGDDYVDDDNDD